MVVPFFVIHLHTELFASIKIKGIMINCLYIIRLRHYAIALSQAICVIIKYFGKSLLKTIFSCNPSRFSIDKNYPREIHNLELNIV